MSEFSIESHAQNGSAPQYPLNRRRTGMSILHNNRLLLQIHGLKPREL